jgi:hypothetical protein
MSSDDEAPEVISLSTSKNRALETLRGEKFEKKR